jgi:hypothetical protein
VEAEVFARDLDSLDRPSHRRRYLHAQATVRHHLPLKSQQWPTDRSPETHFSTVTKAADAFNDQLDDGVSDPDDATVQPLHGDTVLAAVASAAANFLS